VRARAAAPPGARIGAAAPVADEPRCPSDPNLL
jgi:hypothetical protein